jgi:hypothetical protein
MNSHEFSAREVATLIASSLIFWGICVGVLLGLIGNVAYLARIRPALERHRGKKLYSISPLEQWREIQEYRSLCLQQNARVQFATCATVLFRAIYIDLAIVAFSFVVVLVLL